MKILNKTYKTFKNELTNEIEIVIESTIDPNDETFCDADSIENTMGSIFVNIFSFSFQKLTKKRNSCEPVHETSLIKTEQVKT